MKKLVLLFAALMILTATALAQTTSVTLTPEDLAKLDPATRSQINAIQVEKQVDGTVEATGKWVGLGKEIGAAVNESLTAVTTTAADFAETKLGKFTMFLVAYKVIGNDLLQIVFGLIWLIIVIWVSIYLYKNNCDRTFITSKIWNKEAKAFDKTYRFESADDEWKIAAIVIFCIGLIITPMIMFF